MLSRAWSLAQTETMCAAMGALQSPDPMEVPAGTFLSFEMMLQDLEADDVATTVDPGADISAQIAAEVAAAKLAYLPVSLQRDVQKDAHAFLFGEELDDPEEEDGAEAWKPQRVQFVSLRSNGLFPNLPNRARVNPRPQPKPQPKKRAKQQQTGRAISQLEEQPQDHSRASPHPRVVPTRKSRWEMLSTEMQARIRSTGFELGWDMARHGMPMPDDLGRMVPEFAEGWGAAHEHFGARTVKPDTYTRKWLTVRGSALRRNRIFDSEVTPAFLRSVAMPHCPVMRTPLAYGTKLADRDDRLIWSVDRLNNNAGYVVGNVLILSERANKAKGNHGFRELQAMAQLAQDASDGMHEGLTVLEWSRLAYLAALVCRDVSWREIAKLPMRVFLPPSVTISDPLPGIQWKLSALPETHRSPEEGTAYLLKLFPSKHLQRAVRLLVEAFYLAVDADESDDEERPHRWVVEDAWENPVVQTYWHKLIDVMSDDDKASLVHNTGLTRVNDAQWSEAAGLRSRGFVQ